jgi:hypothetical protein
VTAPTTDALAALELTDGPAGVLVPVLVQPRASRDAVAGVHDGRLKLLLKAPPVEGAANEAALRFLAKFLGVPRADVTLKQGPTSRRKTFVVVGRTAADVRAHLAAGGA